MNKFVLDLLTIDDVFGENKLLKKDEIKCIPTDLARLTSRCDNYYGKYCWYFLKDNSVRPKVPAVNSAGLACHDDWFSRSGVIRPIIKINGFVEENMLQRNSREVLFGSYPQQTVGVGVQNVLEELYKKNRLNVTNKIYNFGGLKNCTGIDFRKNKYEIYEYSGSYYIRFEYEPNKNSVVLSNSFTYYSSDYIWLKIDPVMWYLNEKNNLLISQNGLLSCVPYQVDCLNTNYDISNINIYLNECMSFDLIKELNVVLDEKPIRKRTSSYNFDFNNLSQEEMIKGCIESDVPVFLHGAIGDGKSARVKAIDPDLKIIYLRNISFEGLNGKSVYNSTTGEMIDVPPSWYKELKNKCLNEPNKLHILFFDELTNALPSIQGSAFNIILDREVNGIWKLPSNVRMVAAGNEVSDSLSANQLSAPLFSRFAHVYIKTDTLSWLKWASESNIHPAIYTFIAYKNGECLRSMYDGIKPNADPRKWEMASKVLYKIGNPNMLRSLVGDDITDEFIEFCYQKVITLEDVIKGNYNEDNIKNMDASEKYATILALTRVDVKNIDRVRKFIFIMESEMLGIFDSLWAQNDEEKMEVIAEKRLVKKI